MTPAGRGRDAALNVVDHRRDSAGLTYVYPVISRRARGVSLGINLNTNNACNWACVYCQVPGLSRGGPEPVDLDLLEREFRGFLHELVHGDFMPRRVPAEARRLADVAFSGNGEPTSSAMFGDALDRVVTAMRELGVAAEVPVRVITNGSLLGRTAVQQAIARLGASGGEVWFKVDRATRAGIAAVNQVSLDPAGVVERLRSCAALAPTWVQTCWFGRDGQAPDEAEADAYLELIARNRDCIRGVLLYGIARPSLQPDAGRLERLSPEALHAFGRRIEACGVAVSVSP